MTLKKSERQQVLARYGGLCAYCGDKLGEKWHADHMEPIRREWWKAGGGMEWPQNDRLDNMMPSCPPCNIDKGAMPLEQWRKKLQGSTGVLRRNSSTYRHAIRFGLVSETEANVSFYFERAA